jgi:hypothetical protein
MSAPPDILGSLDRPPTSTDFISVGSQNEQIADILRRLRRIEETLVAIKALYREEIEIRGTDAQMRQRIDGRRGGLARAAKLTPEQRSAIARRAALARWTKGKRA